MKFIKQHIPILIFLFIYFFLIALKVILHPTPFYDWDEAINVEVAREMINKLSLVPLWQGKVWLDKPPLPFLFFGLIMKLTPFVMPEISLRLTSLILSLIALFFVYRLILKATENKWISSLAIVLTSFLPIFLQRSQVVNLDVFLLIGWIGYLLYFENFYLSLFFLVIAVLTKSLIGFYAPGIIFLYYLFLFLIQKLNLSKFKQIVKKILVHVAILSLWYLGMLLVFKSAFWKEHIIETHLRRVTSSIESHFGKRTYYLDLASQQLEIFLWPSILGFMILTINFVRDLIKSNKLEKYLYALFLFPWFIFLNVTKTKIFWYLYPSIPQFAFFALFPLFLIRKYQIVFYTLAMVIIFAIIYQNFTQTNFFTTYYSNYENYYYLANYAKNNCNELNILVSKDTRDTTATLESLGLTITSTTQWGDHPSIVYYFGKKVNFFYEESGFIKAISNAKSNTCLDLIQTDNKIVNDNKNVIKLKNFDNFVLYKVYPGIAE